MTPCRLSHLVSQTRYICTNEKRGENEPDDESSGRRDVTLTYSVFAKKRFTFQTSAEVRERERRESARRRKETEMSVS